MQRFNEELEKRFGVHRTAEYRETRFPTFLLSMARYAIENDDLSQFKYFSNWDDEVDVHINLKKARQVLDQIRKDMFTKKRNDLYGMWLLE